MSEIQLVVGLQNPGAQYQLTRHNLGGEVLQAFAKKWGFSFQKEKKFLGLFAKGNFSGRSLCLLLPETYMNLSGRSLQKVAHFYKMEPENILVACDDTAFPLGSVRLRSQGSHGGHNGLLSVEEALQTRSYPRLRVGIGQSQGPTLSAYVLQRFKATEEEAYKLALEQGTWALEQALEKPFDLAMNVVNAPLDKNRKQHN